MWSGPVPVAALALLLALPAAAQEPPAVLADSAADRAIAFFNDPGTVRFLGETAIEAGDTLRSDVAALDGPLRVRGRVEGDVLVLNGDLLLAPGASVTGSATVVGGRVQGAEAATIGGEVTVHEGELRYRRSGFRLVRGDEGWGRGDFLVATGKSYNRVEGLPITFGPRIRTAGSNPLRVDALAIYRTEAGLTLDPEEMGYHARIEQYLGGHRAAWIGFTAHSVIEPIEEWQLSDLESGLATFLFHEDYRDHYERQGVSVYATLSPPGSPLSLGVEARRETHRTLAVGTPWTLARNDDPWRPQPIVAEGDVTALLGTATFDTRSSAADPATGWYVRARLEQAVQSDLQRGTAYLIDPGADPRLSPIPLLEPLDYRLFSSGVIDIRRYNRVDPSSRLNFRLVAGGSLDGDALPPQRQHALGGEGSLPGFPLFHFDCGARAERVYRRGRDGRTTPFVPRYGCDAFSLFQAEYRGSFSFRFLWDSVPWSDEAEEDEDWGFVTELSPDWTFFVDAGQGWSYDSEEDEELAADVGVGVLLGRLGVFVAVPVTGGDGVNLFARIGPRF